MKYLGLITALVLLIGCNSKEQERVEKPLTDKEIISKYGRHIWEAHATIHNYDLSNEVMIIVDMSIHSGKKRMLKKILTKYIKSYNLQTREFYYG